MLDTMVEMSMRINPFYVSLSYSSCGTCEYAYVSRSLLLVNKNSESVTFWSNRYIDMAESLCQKRALEAFRLDPTKWGGNVIIASSCAFYLFLNFANSP